MVRVVVITDRATCPIPDMLARLRAIVRAVPPGALRIQIRDKQLDGGALLAFARDAIAIAGERAEVWVNDRVDVALAAGARGVHLPERGLAIADARALGVSSIGCSRHSIEGVRAAAKGGADVVHLGPIWSTPSKQGLIEPLGPGALAIGREVGIPLVAVGGIDSPDRAREAARAGASAVAVIRAAWTSPDPAVAIAALVAAF